MAAISVLALFIATTVLQWAWRNLISPKSRSWLTTEAEAIFHLKQDAEELLAEAQSQRMTPCSTKDDADPDQKRRRTQKDEPVVGLDLLRVGAMLWVVVGHAYQNVQPFLGDEQLAVFNRAISSSLSLQIVANFTLAVDVFFFISALLLARGFLQDSAVADERQLFSLTFWPKRWLRRALRLWPGMAWAGVLAEVIQMSNAHPLVPIQVPGVCLADGWRQFVFGAYIFGNTCWAWFWYLSVDFTLHIVCTPLLILLRRGHVSSALLLSLAAYLACALYGASVQSAYNFPPTVNIFHGQSALHNNDIGSFCWLVYVRPFHHAAPFLIGLFVGTFLVLANPRRLFLTAATKVGLLAGAATFMTYAIVGAYPSLNDIAMPWIYDIFYGQTFRGAFALGCACLVVLWNSGHQANDPPALEKTRFVAVLARLSYGVYLFHYIVSAKTFETMRQPVCGSHSCVIDHSMLHIAMGALSSFGCAVLFEKPVERMLRRYTGL